MNSIDSITIAAAGWGLLVLRLTLALILWPHGAQKVLGWFGGAGWDGTYRTFTEKWAFRRSSPRWPCSRNSAPPSAWSWGCSHG